MKIVIQRVKKAEVKVPGSGKTAGKIDAGYLILLGIRKGDTEKDMNYLAEKVAKLRVMADAGGKMNLSLKDSGGEVLLVSQFTLYADASTGNRPSFIKAEDPEKAKDIYMKFIEKLKGLGLAVETGVFGEYMEILSVLDGPVTIILEN